MNIVDSIDLETDLLDRLQRLDEITASGFAVRRGMTGAGVTMLYGRTYLGNWRGMLGTLVWKHANANQSDFFAETVDDAVRFTLLMILQRLETKRRLKAG